jgi:hypothetical protein
MQQFGYRDWMRTGITFTGNRDLTYFGLRQIGAGEDVTETTIAWTDNNNVGEGPDDLVFRFIGGTNSNTVSSNFQSTTDADGLNIARFAPTGEIGFGSTFGIPDVGGGVGLGIMSNTLCCGEGIYPSLPTASVDIWKSCSNGTNNRWYSAIQISGLNNRFEKWANSNLTTISLIMSQLNQEIY